MEGLHVSSPAKALLFSPVLPLTRKRGFLSSLTTVGLLLVHFDVVHDEFIPKETLFFFVLPGQLMCYNTS
ncbi:MAG: hypothetical protein ACYTBJ_05620 [Planctomycetota bacterium]|jgi:hypothetical protein